MERRYGGDARVVYHNAESADVRETHVDVIARIDEQGLIYPVTVIDGTPVYDGAVSYPAIMRAVHNKLLEREGASAT
jgi:disulfide oxidoreductase YuzD